MVGRPSVLVFIMAQFPGKQRSLPIVLILYKVQVAPRPTEWNCRHQGFRYSHDLTGPCYGLEVWRASPTTLGVVKQEEKGLQ